MTPNLTQHEIAELASMYALGLLPSDEHDAFEARLLAGDTAYTAEFGKIQGVGDALLRQASPVAAPKAKLPPANASAHVTSSDTIRLVSPERQVRFWRASSAFGWLAAAASLVFALIVWQTNKPKPVPPTPRELSYYDISSMKGTANLQFVPWPAKAQGEVASSPNPGMPVAGSETTTGVVAWNNDIQDGFIQLSNLPLNDASSEQYQLWIIDADQPAPVSAGVFDASSRTTTVRMKPYVRINKPVAVAVTLEKAGGVTVPDQTKRVVVAPVPKG